VQVHDIVRNSEEIADPLCITDIFIGTAARTVRPELGSEADHLVALFLEKSGGNRTVYAPLIAIAIRCFIGERGNSRKEAQETQKV